MKDNVIQIRAIKPKFKQPFTRFFFIPKNIYNWLPELEPCQLACFLHVCYMTSGYQKYSDEISMTQFCAGTGYGRAAISRAIKWLEREKFIRVIRAHRKVSIYEPLQPPFRIILASRYSDTKK